MSEVKPRILNPRLAAIVAELRHGELVCIADSGSGTSEQSLRPISPKVEVLDLGVVTGSPSAVDVVSTLWAAGDFEAAFVTKEMREANPEGRAFIEELAGPERVHEIDYKPDFYLLRDKVKAFVQTGDCSVHGNYILVGGYPSPPISPDRILENAKA